MTINTKVEQTKGKPGDREHHHSQFGGYFVSEMIFIWSNKLHHVNQYGLESKYECTHVLLPLY